MGALAVVISKETAGVMVAFLGAVGALYGTRNTWWNSRASEDRATRDELRQALERESTLRRERDHLTALIERRDIRIEQLTEEVAKWKPSAE